jgi:hypothetical protein
LRLLREALSGSSCAWRPFVTGTLRDVIFPAFACVKIGGGSLANHLSIDEPGIRAVEVAEFRGKPTVLFGDSRSPKSGIDFHVGVA